MIYINWVSYKNENTQICRIVCHYTVLVNVPVQTKQYPTLFRSSLPVGFEIRLARGIILIQQTGNTCITNQIYSFVKYFDSKENHCYSGRISTGFLIRRVGLWRLKVKFVVSNALMAGQPPHLAAVRRPRPSSCIVISLTKEVKDKRLK